MKRIVALVVPIVAMLALAPVAMGGPSLLGKWKIKIKNDAALGGQLNGTWVLNFTAGHYKATQNGSLAVKGKNTISGKKISFKDTAGPAKCSGTGKYKFKISGNKLRFTLVSEPSACVGRKGVLTHGAFSQVT
jgi:hypothetical protein